MNDTISFGSASLFTETQQFRQWWLWLALIVVPIIMIWQLFVVYPLSDVQWPEMFFAVVVPFIVIVAVVVLFMLSKLETIIDDKGIHYRFTPFNLRWHTIPFSDIQEVNMRQYSFIEYGGWGIRWSVFGKGWAYNVSGNMGLQIVKSNGRKFLIGTQKAGELSEAINRLRQQNLLPPSR